jgi:hypothetical protein
MDGSGLLACNGRVGDEVPYWMSVTIDYGAFEIANLAPIAFARILQLSSLDLRFFALSPDKYGRVVEQRFFETVVTREENSKMNWNWFKSTIFKATFDPTAFVKFDIIAGSPPVTQDRDGIFRVLRRDSEKAVEAYGLPDPDGTAVTAASQMANWTNCFN